MSYLAAESVLQSALIACGIVLAIVLVSVAAAATEFFMQHHRIRVQHSEPLFSYYSHLATGH